MTAKDLHADIQKIWLILAQRKVEPSGWSSFYQKDHPVTWTTSNSHYNLFSDHTTHAKLAFQLICSLMKFSHGWSCHGYSIERIRNTLTQLKTKQIVTQALLCYTWIMAKWSLKTAVLPDSFWASEADSLKNKVLALQRQVGKARLYENINKRFPCTHST